MQTKSFAILFILLFFSGKVFAESSQQCSLCGMDLHKYSHVRYTVETTDKEQISTCGVQCGLLLQLNLGERFAKSMATTLLGHKYIPAQNAWYVYRSVAITDMSPGFIAFASKEHAKRFSTGFGGKVVSFEQALQIVKDGFPQ